MARLRLRGKIQNRAGEASRSVQYVFAVCHRQTETL